ncbi:hypothetical protein AGMMS4956_07510 [Bacteroidia bacterium]|nr:hypothetical protein AGMMS4956_07510 [Bacteroidia bacterium]
MANFKKMEETQVLDIEAINRNFNVELQQQIDGTLPKGHVYQMGMPQGILLSIGVPNMPIELIASRLTVKSTQENHIFNLTEVKDLPKAISNPIAVFSYGDKSKAVNIITEIEHNDNKFLVGMSLNPEVDGKKLEINSIRNVFPRDTSNWVLWIQQGKALYLNKEKIKVQMEQQRKTLADVPHLDINYIAKIINNFENPIILAENSQEIVKIVNF